MRQEYTTFKVPKSYRSSANAIRSEIARRGLDNTQLRYALADKHCPICKAEMQPAITVGVEYTCPKCQVSKPVVELSTPASQADEILKAVGVTALSMLGLYFVAKALESKDDRR